MTDDVTADASAETSAETAPSGDVWMPVASSAELVKRRKVVVDVDGRPVLVLAHEGRLCAFDNICIHKERELAKGVVMNGKIVCPGHQWAFALDSGWESVKERCQPTWIVQERDAMVWLDVTSRAERPPGTR